MGTMATAAAERRPTAVWLNLGDLERLLQSLAQANPGRRGQVSPEVRPLARKITRARDRRLRAVERTRRS